jgi:hypothetical protein
LVVLSLDQDAPYPFMCCAKISDGAAMEITKRYKAMTKNDNVRRIIGGGDDGRTVDERARRDAPPICDIFLPLKINERSGVRS